jgi:hypothetical protein
MNGWQALRAGLDRATRYWQVWMVLYAANFLGALLLAVLPALSIVSELGHRGAIRQAADGLDAWYVLETLMSPGAVESLGQAGPQPGEVPFLQQALLIALFTLAVLPLLAWLPASFMSGGLLLTYASSPQPFGWRRFWWGCWHWLGTYLLLGLVQASVLMLTLILGAVLVIVALNASPWLVAPLCVALGLWLVAWLAMMELSRTAAVIAGTKNPFTALVGGLRFILRHPWPVVGLYALSVLSAVALHAVWRLGLTPHLRLEWWLPALLLQQLFLLARLGIRLVRIGGGVRLMEEAAMGVPYQPEIPTRRARTAGNRYHSGAPDRN